MKKKKHTVSPETARILEQYRNAGKPQPGAGMEGSTPPALDSDAADRLVPPAAPVPSSARRRSGTRGK